MNLSVRENFGNKEENYKRNKGRKGFKGTSTKKKRSTPLRALNRLVCVRGYFDVEVHKPITNCYIKKKERERPDLLL